MATAALCCVRYMAAAGGETVDTTHLPIASLSVALKYLGHYDHDRVTGAITAAHQAELKMSKEDAEAWTAGWQKMERSFAKRIWFDILNPNSKIQSLLKYELSIPGGPLVQSVANEIVRAVGMSPVWVEYSPNLVTAAIVLVATSVASLVYPKRVSAPGALNEIFEETLVTKMHDYANDVTAIVKKIVGSAEVIPKVLKKLKSKVTVDMVLGTVYKLEQSAERTIDDWNDEKLPPLKTLLAAIRELENPHTKDGNDEENARRDVKKVVNIKTKSGSGETSVWKKRLWSKLWVPSAKVAVTADGDKPIVAREAFNNASSLHELCILRRILAEKGGAHHIWQPEKFVIVKEDEEDPVAICLVSDGKEPLANFLKRKKDLPCSDLVKIAKQLVEAVAHCVSEGVLHCSLSPNNIFVYKGKEEGYEVTLKGFGNAITYRRKDKIVALDGQWKKFERWRSERKKMEEKRKETSDKNKIKQIEKDIAAIQAHPKAVLKDSLKRFEALKEEGLLQMMAPEILMCSQVYTEMCEAWSLGSVLFFIFSRGKMFASGSEKKEGQAIDDYRRELLKTIFGRCSRAHIPKQIRSYPGRLNISEKKEEDGKYKQKMVSWLKKRALEDDDESVLEKIAGSINQLLQIHPRNRLSLRQFLKDDPTFGMADFSAPKTVGKSARKSPRKTPAGTDTTQKRKLEGGGSASAAKKSRVEGPVDSPSAPGNHGGYSAPAQSYGGYSAPPARFDNSTPAAQRWSDAGPDARQEGEVAEPRWKETRESESRRWSENKDDSRKDNWNNSPRANHQNQWGDAADNRTPRRWEDEDTRTGERSGRRDSRESGGDRRQSWGRNGGNRRQSWGDGGGNRRQSWGDDNPDRNRTPKRWEE